MNLAQEHDDRAMNGYLFGINNNHGKTHFAFDDSEVTKDGKQILTWLNGMYPADYYCSDDKCELVSDVYCNYGNTLVIGAGETVTLQYRVYGNDPVVDGSDTYNTGNDIIVTVTFTADAYGYVTAVASYSVEINNAVNGNLNSVDIQKLANLGTAINND